MNDIRFGDEQFYFLCIALIIVKVVSVRASHNMCWGIGITCYMFGVIINKIGRV